ncbi:MAG: glycosyltransferase family 29 protein [Kangiellaceae bacterium]|jgi:hypothetical protein|nr:glycosyltransferase family 29 protein [Kangiellaceae bacterium]
MTERKTPAKPSLRKRILNPLPGIRRAADPTTRRKRVLFLWSKGAHAGQLGEITPDMLENAEPEEGLALAAILLEAGHMTQATALASQVYGAHPDLMARCRYPALTLAMSKMQPDLVAHLAPEVAMLDTFAHQGDLFGDLVTARANSIAIVGNSPVLLDHTAGAEIDDHDVVIRFNNYQLGPDMRGSTGRRTTVWFHTGGYDWLWRRDRAVFELSVLPGRAGFYRCLNGQDLILDHALRGQVCDFIPHNIYHSLLKTHDVGAPSMGLLCLAWVHDLLGGLGNVSLYGFRMLDQPQFQTSDYFDQGHPSAKHPHDWIREYEALRALCPDRFPPALTAGISAEATLTSA